jgi:hypothetical protein
MNGIGSREIVGELILVSKLNMIMMKSNFANKERKMNWNKD